MTYKIKTAGTPTADYIRRTMEPDAAITYTGAEYAATVEAIETGAISDVARLTWDYIRDMFSSYVDRIRGYQTSGKNYNGYEKVADHTATTLEAYKPVFQIMGYKLIIEYTDLYPMDAAREKTGEDRPLESVYELTLVHEQTNTGAGCVRAYF